MSDRAQPESPQFCPFKGLQPYCESDYLYFFCRRREIEVIVSNLFAAPLTVMYGASGVGKSSVLLAGVLPRLKQLPHVIGVVFRDWHDSDFVLRLKEQVLAAVRAAGFAESNIDLQTPLDDFLWKCTCITRGSLFVIFDQFEEYPLYHPPSTAVEGFDVEFARAVNRKDIDVNFLLAMREIGLGRLDRFHGRIPGLLQNLLPLAGLTSEAAREAITAPIAEYNRQYASSGLQSPIEIEPRLIDVVLEQVRAGEVTLGREGVGFVPGIDEQFQDRTRIETPYLQLVMTRLWKEELKKSSSQLRLETLERLGGSDRIVQMHLSSVMRMLTRHERDAAAQMFFHLVTPSGDRVAQTAASLAQYAKLSDARTQSILKELSRGSQSILRSVPSSGNEPNTERYEVFHLVLAKAVLAWRTNHLRKKAFRRYGVLGFVLLMAVITAGLSFGLEKLQRAETALEVLQKEKEISEADFSKFFELSYLKDEGDTAYQGGRMEDAHQIYSEALEWSEKLLIEMHGKDRFLEDEVLSTKSELFRKLGDTLRKQHRRDRAVDSYRQAIELKNELLDQVTTSSDSIRSTLESCYDALAELSLEQHDFVNAKKNRQNAIENALAWTNAFPENQTAKTNLATSYDRMGSLLMRLGDIVRAREYFDQSLKIRQDLVSMESIVDSYEALGRAFADSGDPAISHEYWQKVLEEYRKMEEVGPTDSDTKEGIATAYEWLADMSLQLGQMDAAREFANKCVSYREDLVGEGGNYGKYSLSLAYGWLGEVTFQLGDLENSDDAFHKYFNLSEEIAKAEPAEYLDEFADANFWMGAKSLAKGDAASARDHTLEAIKVRKELSEADPEHKDQKRKLALDYGQLADAILELGDIPAAADDSDKSLEMRRALAQVDPSPLAQTDLAYAFGRIGWLKLCESDFNSATTWFERGVEVFEKLERDGKLFKGFHLREFRRQRSWLAAAKATPEALGNLTAALEFTRTNGPELLFLRALQLTRRGEHGSVIETADSLRAIEPEDPENLYSLARCYALCTRAVRKGRRPGQLALNEQCVNADFADRSMEALSEAVAHGYQDYAGLLSDPNIDIIRSQPGYRELMMRISTSTSAKEPQR